MIESNNQAFPPEVSGVRQAMGQAPDHSTMSRNAPLKRPLGVTLISALLFLAGGALLVYTLVQLLTILNEPTHTFIMVFGFGLIITMLLYAAVLLLAALGLWRLRIWGLLSAIASLVLFLLRTLFVVVMVARDSPLALLSVVGLLTLLAMLVVAAMLVYLVQPRVRAQFR
jgi:hypothetical protein